MNPTIPIDPALEMSPLYSCVSNSSLSVVKLFCYLQFRDVPPTSLVVKVLLQLLILFIGILVLREFISKTH